jgi:hypothetical protein
MVGLLLLLCYLAVSDGHTAEGQSGLRAASELKPNR